MYVWRVFNDNRVFPMQYGSLCIEDRIFDNKQQLKKYIFEQILLANAIFNESQRLRAQTRCTSCLFFVGFKKADELLLAQSVIPVRNQCRRSFSILHIDPLCRLFMFGRQSLWEDLCSFIVESICPISRLSTQCQCSWGFHRMKSFCNKLEFFG